MRGRNVFVAGGGNSAGQTALHMAKWAGQVTILVRATVAGRQHVRLPHPPDRRRPEHRRLLPRAGRRRHRHRRRPSPIAGTGRHRLRGAAQPSPRTPCSSSSAPSPAREWLGESVARDQWGFIRTGPDLPAGTHARWPPGRPPLPLETSLPGVFAAGDVRHGSVKRVASAVGEGAATIPLVHRYLAQPLPPGNTRPGRQPPRPASTPRPEHRQRPGDRAYAHRAQRDRHPAS